MASMFRWPNRSRKSRVDDSSQSGTGAPQPNFAAAGARSTQHPLITPSGPIQSENENENAIAGSLEAAKGPSYHQISQEDLFPKKQIYGLRILHEPPEPLVDIIFVHGLTGNSYDTWLEMRSGIYWPVQLFSKDVPDARIMAFGYDADVTKFLGPVGQNNIRDHASNLLGDLAARRAEDDSVGDSLYRV
jgi:hypothetical protein